MSTMSTDIENNIERRDIFLLIADTEFDLNQIKGKDGYTSMHWTRDLIDSQREFDQTELLQTCLYLMEALLNAKFEEAKNSLTCDETELEDKPSSPQIREDINSLCAKLEKYAACINTRYKYENLAEFSRTNKSLMLYINKHLDEQGILRNSLWGMYNSEDKLCINDAEYNPPKLERISCDEPIKKCFYFNQECAAQMLLKRIEFILGKYHNKKLADFDDFDFMIYTARSNMLEKQTINRLCAESAECFPQDAYSDLIQLEEMARKRVRKYVYTNTIKQELESMKSDAERHKKKLILVVADEAHWGISGQTNLGVSANNALVNAWNDQFSNVIVLLVTATPWNLLTQNSRIPEVSVVEKQKTGELIEVKRNGNRLVDITSGLEVTNEVGAEKELHILKWTESCEDSFKRGLIIVFRVPQKERDPEIWLTVREEKKRFILAGTFDKSQATPFFVKMSNNVISVTTHHEDVSKAKILIITKRNQEFSVEFVLKDLVNVKDKNLCFKYKLLMDFGEDIIELQPCHENMQNYQLKYDYNKQRVSIGKRPAENEIDVLVYHSWEYSFIVDYKHELNSTEPGEQYMSLNFLYNTMRNKDPQTQLIRDDERFQRMTKCLESSGFKLDDILAAEYSYYITIVNLIRQTFAERRNLDEFLNYNENILERYFSSRDKKIHIFQEKLTRSEQSDDTFRSISHSVFVKVVEYLQDESWENLLYAVKSLSKYQTDKNTIYDLIIDSLVAFFIHAKNDMTDMKKKVSSMKELLSNHMTQLRHQFSSRNEWKKQLLLTNHSETFKIINDLITDDRTRIDMKGKMKIIRVNDKATGNRFYASLSLARQLENDDKRYYFFEIIRYFEKLKLYDKTNMNKSCKRIWQELQRKQCNSLVDEKTREKCSCNCYVNDEESITCKQCKHDHNKIEQFADLNNLPCIVIVIEKARIGETFPESLNCMDLRLRHQSSKPKLTSLMQELGRLCRYQEKRNYSDMPYVLVGPKVKSSLREYLRESAVFYSSFKKGNVDMYIRPVEEKKVCLNKAGGKSRRASHQPNNKNYDSGNEKQHSNRLLLQAEPQIGKTGVYLKLISLLRTNIIRTGRPCSQIQILEDIYNNESYDEIENCENWVPDRNFPYWKDMRNEKTPLRTNVTQLKHCTVFGDYEYQTTPSVFKANTDMISNKLNRAMETRALQVFSASNQVGFEAFSHTEHSQCLECKSDAPVKQYNFRMVSVESQIKIFVPSIKRYKPLIDTLNRGFAVFEDTVRSDSNLETWIFSPSYNRATDATINYYHTMVTENKKTQYVQILVVRPDDFNRYATLWQSTHAIIELPVCLPDCDVDMYSGGVGFARRFIQLFAEQLNLKKVFMLDDNIHLISRCIPEVITAKFSLDMKLDQSVEIQNIPFFDALKRLENLFNCEKRPMSANFENYMLDDLDSDCIANKDVHTYTGPKGSYGITGIVQYNSGSSTFRSEFRKAHVHSLVLVNIAALKERSILYKPWQVYEDLNINNDCDEKKLTVCKFNRLMFCKKSLKPWMPTVYIWSEKDIIRKDQRYNTMRERSSKIILQWLKMHAPPKRFEIRFVEGNNLKQIKFKDSKLESQQNMNGIKPIILQELESFLLGFVSTRLGKSHVVALIGRKVSNRAREKIHEYFSATKGIGGFFTHIIIIATAVCLKLNLTTLGNIRRHLVEPVFEENSKLVVLTSHSIANNTVPFVVVCVEGKSK